MTGKRHSFFSGVWCMLFYGILKTKPWPGGGGPEKTTCLYPPLTTAETGPTVSSFKLSRNQEPFWEKAFVFLVWRHPMKSFNFVWLIWQWGCHKGNFDWYREQAIAREGGYQCNFLKNEGNKSSKLNEKLCNCSLFSRTIYKSVLWHEISISRTTSLSDSFLPFTTKCWK